MEKIATLSGRGKVFFEDSPVCDAEYRLDVFQEFIEGRTFSGPYSVPGMKSARGYVIGPMPMAQELKLVGEDGCSFTFYVMDSNGSITVSGPILDRDGKNVA